MHCAQYVHTNKQLINWWLLFTVLAASWTGFLSVDAGAAAGEVERNTRKDKGKAGSDCQDFRLDCGGEMNGGAIYLRHVSADVAPQFSDSPDARLPRKDGTPPPLTS